MSALDGLRKTSFSGQEFPNEGTILHSVGRQYLFEFPKQPGGAFEKLGRGVWAISVHAVFAQGLRGYADALYPDTMNALRALYETQVTATLVHPTVGEIQAFISGWKQTYDPRRMRNGERVEIEFVEDQPPGFLTQGATASINATTVLSSQADLDREIALVKASLPVSQNAQSLFDAIRAASNAISTVTSAGGMYSTFLQAKATELSNLCAQADQLPELGGSLSVGALDALKNLWAASTAFTNPPTGSGLSTWFVQMTASITEIAAAIYNDTSRATELLNLNGALIANPYRVPAGTELNYFPPPGNQSRATPG